MITAFDILLDEHSISEKHDQSILVLETYFVINYFNRHIKKYKLEYGEVTTLNLILGGKSDYLEYNSDWPETRKVLACILSDSYEEVKLLSGIERTKKVLSLFEKASSLYEGKIIGINKCVREILNSFQKENYLNDWIFQKKTIKELGTVILQCSLTITSFKLYFVVEKNKEVIYKKLLLSSRPDSVFYNNLFKKIHIEGDTVHLLGRIVEQPFFSISFDEILNNSDGKFQSEHPSMPDYIYDSKKEMYIYRLEKGYDKQKGTRWWKNFKDKHDLIE